jgi:hypothetical protein
LLKNVIQLHLISPDSEKKPAGRILCQGAVDANGLHHLPTSLAGHSEVQQSDLFAADPMMSPHEISRSEPSARLPKAQSLAKSITFPHFFSHEKWKSHETNPPSWFPPNSMSQRG